MSTVKRKLLTAVVVITLFAMLLGPGTSVASANWSAPRLSYTPSTAWVGDTVYASFTIQATDSSTVGISSSTLTIDWGSKTTTVDSMTGTMALTPGGRTTLHCSFIVPQVADGTYTMTFKITGKAAGDWLSTTYQWTMPLTVKNIPPLTVDLNAVTNSGIAPMTTSFDATVRGGDGAYQYYWTFGDGASSMKMYGEHTYTAAGTYTANLRVTDAHGNIASGSTTVTVAPALAISASSSVTSGTSPLAISFTSTPSGGSGSYKYAWTFGDGSTSTVKDPSHTYEKAGTYNVKVTVTDSGGRTMTDTMTIKVDKPSPLDLANTAGDGPYLLLGIIAIAAVAVILALFMAKKKKTPPSIPPQNPPMQPPTQ